MSPPDADAESRLLDEESLRWGFLEDETEACAVVSQRMELVYINRAGRRLVPARWFGRRCFEVLPHVNEQCAWHCPTIKAVADSPEVVYCEERVHGEDGQPVTFGVAVIPVPQVGGDPAKAVLLLRPRPEGENPSGFRAALLRDGARLLLRLAPHLE